MEVAKFFAVNGPSGTYSHFWMSRAVRHGRKLVSQSINQSIVKANEAIRKGEHVHSANPAKGAHAPLQSFNKTKPKMWASASAMSMGSPSSLPGPMNVPCEERDELGSWVKRCTGSHNKPPASPNNAAKTNPTKQRKQQQRQQERSTSTTAITTTCTYHFKLEVKQTAGSECRALGGVSGIHLRLTAGSTNGPSRQNDRR